MKNVSCFNLVLNNMINPDVEDGFRYFSPK